MKPKIKINREVPLAKRKCTEYAKRLVAEETKAFRKDISPKWALKGKRQLERAFEFPDFKQAWNFTNRIGKLAEQQQHHPDIFLSYGEVRLQLSTHHAGGLTENDFIMAAKIDGLK